MDRDQNTVLFNGLFIFQAFLCFEVEGLLTADPLLAAEINVDIARVALHISCIGRVAEHGVQDSEGASLLHFILDGEDKLDAAIQITRHPVGTAHVDARITAVFKAEDAAVLEELTDNAHNCDVVAHAGNAGDQTADAANDHADLYTGL